MGTYNRRSLSANGGAQGLKNQRPVDLAIDFTRLPITAIASIFHRLTGLALLLGTAPLIYLYGISLESEVGYEYVRQTPWDGWRALVAVIVASSVIYHVLAGVRHLIMDFAGIGEATLRQGQIGARAVLILWVLATILTIVMVVI